MLTYFGHSRNAHGQRQGLLDHLRAVSELTAQFASAFGAGELGRYAGLWHDVGKFNPDFRDYLLRCEADPNTHGRGPDHKAAGTMLAAQYAPPLALLLQGHHGRPKPLPALGIPVLRSFSEASFCLSRRDRRCTGFGPPPARQ